MVSWMKITIRIVHFRVRGQVREKERVMKKKRGEISQVLSLLKPRQYWMKIMAWEHQRCACHLLNLISTADALKANGNPVYKRLSRSAFSKCSSLWSKSSRSTTAAEIIQDNCKLQLLRPNETRFTPVELAFLAEYTKTMGPFAKALDVLQGEANVQMGWLVSTIILLQAKLQHLCISVL
ncbi:hypothetical protein DPEC_G00221170 [Dallia pectoralis]|uniref:Uncharacterized protein n=1 Tax=Dallia pectoralis TaxID=75939 RepID=A0ACC2G3V9_DALPE|nr:hypothetical protein DPEC_G00221170 [Dallia pectoralis]